MSAVFFDLRQRLFDTKAWTVRTVRRHCFNRVGHGQNPGLNKDLIAFESVWITRAIHSLVVLTDHGRYGPREIDTSNNLVAHFRVHLEHFEFNRCQPCRLTKQLIRNAYFSQVVDQGAQVNSLYLCVREFHVACDGSCELSYTPLVSGGVGVARFNRRRNRINGSFKVFAPSFSCFSAMLGVAQAPGQENN